MFRKTFQLYDIHYLPISRNPLRLKFHLLLSFILLIFDHILDSCFISDFSVFQLIWIFTNSLSFFILIKIKYLYKRASPYQGLTSIAREYAKNWWSYKKNSKAVSYCTHRIIIWYMLCFLFSVNYYNSQNSVIYFSQIFRSSPSEMFWRKGVLKICRKFTGEYPCLSAILIKLQSN